MADTPTALRLKVSGAGHNVELTVCEADTIGTIKAAVHQATGLHPAYQRLLVRGKAFDDDSVSCETAGIGDRTKLMLMHSAAYSRDASAVEAITKVSQELDALELGVDGGSIAPAARDELATQLCCRLDAVDVGDSATLRELRRAQLRRCEQWSRP
jgi:hypothetical protein